jgi:hypothetical protein
MKVKDKRLQSLYSDLVAKLNQRNVSVVGLGRTAFTRTSLFGLVDDFRILCIKESQDLECIRESFPVYTVEEDFENAPVEKQNTSSLLSVPQVQKHISQIDPPVCLFIYKSSPKIQAIIDTWNVELLSTRSEIRKYFEFKWEFRQIAIEEGIPLIMGEQLYLSELNSHTFKELQAKYGKKLVFQLTDFKTGGGKGTFCLSSQDELDEMFIFIEAQRTNGKELERVNITQFIEGESASIAGCVTRYGTFTGQLQRQLIDIPEVVDIENRMGVFSGHEWGNYYNDELNQQAADLVKQLGKVMADRGYLGIFGIDVIIDWKNQKVNLVECNSRYTGAFPMYSMLQKKAGEIPLDLWHLLEHSGMDYQVDFDLVQSSYNTPKKGAQLILHNLYQQNVQIGARVQSGVYAINQGNPQFLRCGYDIADLQNDEEMILTDGIPLQGEISKGGNRIGRLLFGRSITSDRGKHLDPVISQTVKRIYDLYQLKPI